MEALSFYLLCKSHVAVGIEKCGFLRLPFLRSLAPEHKMEGGVRGRLFLKGTINWADQKSGSLACRSDMSKIVLSLVRGSQFS